MRILNGQLSVGRGPVRFKPYEFIWLKKSAPIVRGSYDLARAKLVLEGQDGEQHYTPFTDAMADAVAARMRRFRGLWVGKDWVSIEILTGGDRGCPKAH